jgi:hypothetical protein
MHAIIRDYKFLDDFSFVMSVHLSVRVKKNQLLEGISWNYILNVVRKSVEKIQVSLKPEKNNCYLPENQSTFTRVSDWIRFGVRNISKV